MQNLKDSFKLVLVVTPKQVERFVEDDEFQQKKETLVERLRSWMSSEIEPEK